MEKNWEMNHPRKWSQGDSNPRPSACHADALPTAPWPRPRNYGRNAAPMQPPPSNRDRRRLGRMAINPGAGGPSGGPAPPPAGPWSGATPLRVRSPPAPTPAVSGPDRKRIGGIDVTAVSEIAGSSGPRELSAIIVSRCLRAAGLDQHGSVDQRPRRGSSRGGVGKLRTHPDQSKA